MKYINSWSSEYRKKKFYQRRAEKAFKEKLALDKISDSKEINSIAIMLDLERTSDDIDMESASIFVRELDTIRKKFNAKYCYICISTHSGSCVEVKRVLDYISPYTNKNIRIGKSFFYGGSYEYETDEVTNEGSFFNYNKIETFKRYYLNNQYFDNVWFCIADDSLDLGVFNKYKDIHPCLFIKPGSSEKQNFMCKPIETKGFDGVIESLDIYIKSIKRYSINDILRSQMDSISHVSSFEVTNKVRNHEYEFLIRYFEDNYADEHDYYDTLTWLGITKNEIIEEEFDMVQRLLGLLKTRLSNEDNMAKILELENYCISNVVDV